MNALDLDTLKKQDWARHSRFPTLPNGAAIVPCRECDGCAQAAAAGHETLVAWTWGNPRPGEDERLSLKALRAMQWLVWRLAVGHGLVGWDPGFLINAERSYNFADAVPYVLISASGHECLLELQDPDGDVLNVQLWAGRTREPEWGIGWINGDAGWGMMQPGDILQFHMPSVLAFQSRPMVVQLLGRPSARRLHVKVDRDVSHALSTVWDAPVAVSSWREAGDPPRWNTAAHFGPDPAGRRCANCLIDFSKSLGNLGIGAGVAVNEDGEHWFCAKHTWRTKVAVDTNNDGIPDTWVHTVHHPTGLDDFPEDGYCDQVSCDQYESARDARWVTRDDCGQAFQQLWCATDIKLRQGIPGYSDFRNYSLSRVECPSIQHLFGHGVNIATPAGLHEQMAFWRGGGHGEMVIYEDDAGEHVRVRTGHAWDPWDNVMRATPPGRGTLAGTVTDHRKHPDALDYGDDLVSTDDRLNHPERIGARVVRDTGERAGRGYAGWSHAEIVERWLVLPKLRADQVGTHDRGEAKLVRLASPVTIGGVAWGGYIEIPPIRQSAKTPVQVCSRTIHSVAALSGGRYQLDLENVMFRAGLPAGDPGARYDRIFTWWAGGGAGTPAEAWASVHNYYQGGDFGSPLGGLVRGDSVGFELAVDGQDLSPRRFVVDDVIPHGGAAAANWGEERIIRRFELGGCWRPDPANTQVGLLPDGGVIPGEVVWPGLTTVHARTDEDDFVGVTTQAAITSGVVLRVVPTGELVRVTGVVYLGNQMTLGIARGHAGTPPAAMPEGAKLEWVITRSDTGAALVRRTGTALPDLATGEWWWDEAAGAAHFAAADAGGEVAIRYGVEGQDKDEAHCHLEEFMVVGVATVLLDVAWSTPGTRVLRRLPEGTALDATLEENDGGVIRVTADLSLAGVLGDLEIATGELAADPPGAIMLAGDYETFGRLRDRIVVLDESGLLASAGAALANVTLTGWWSAAWFMPLSGPPQRTAYGADEWESLEAGDWLSDHSAGRVWLSQAWLAGMGAAEFCLRV